MLSRCTPKQQNGNTPSDWQNKTSQIHKSIISMSNKQRNSNKNKNGKKHKKCTSLSNNTIWPSPCTKNVNNMTIWSDLSPNLDPVYSNKLILLSHKSFTKKLAISNQPNNITSQLVPGEQLWKCIETKICGKKQSDALNSMEKMTTLANSPKNGQSLSVLNKAWRWCSKWTLSTQLLNIFPTKVTLMRHSRWPINMPNTKSEMFTSNSHSNLKMKKDTKKQKLNLSKQEKLMKQSACIKISEISTQL